VRPDVPTVSGVAGGVEMTVVGSVFGAVVGSGVTGAVLATGSVVGVVLVADCVLVDALVVEAVGAGVTGADAGTVLVADCVLVDALVVEAVGAGATGADSGTVLVADCVLVDALVVDAALVELVVEPELVVEETDVTFPFFHESISVESVSNDWTDSPDALAIIIAWALG